MRLDRLMKIAEALRTRVPKDNHFCMRLWGKDHWTSEYCIKQWGECGFAGCAIGWAMELGLFPGELTRGPDWGYGWAPMVKGFDDCSGHAPMDALAYFFDIPYYQTNDLFSAYGPNKETPEQVADNIEKFVAERLMG